MNKLLPILSLLIIVGCSQNEQPTEIEKSLIEPMSMQCMIAVNTQRGIPDDPNDLDFGVLDQMTGAISSMTELMNDVGNPTKKKWKVSNIDDQRTISMSFGLSDKDFDCDFIQPEIQWKLYEVRRNNEVVFNFDEDRLAKEENQKLAIELKAKEKAKEIMLWTEKNYSNVSYKYYEKQHSKSSDSFMEPVLKVDCNPDDLYTYIKYDHGGFSGKKGLNIVITMKDGRIDDSLKDIAVSSTGLLGTLQENEYSFEVSTDGMTSLMLGSVAGSISSVELDGYKFNFDDIAQVPCIK